MDISETYLRMCDCPEIQELYPLAEEYLPNTCFYRGEFLPLTHARLGVWLPRQDQLQEMIDPSCSQGARLDLIYYAYKFLENDLVAMMRINSMEQLWLAFYMKEKFNKVWDGENWQKHR